MLPSQYVNNLFRLYTFYKNFQRVNHRFFIINMEVPQSMSLLRVLRKNDFTISFFLSKNPKRKDGFSQYLLKGGKK